MLKKFKALIENSSQGVKSSVAFALASAVSAGMSYLTTPVFTRMLTSTEYGEVTIYLTWQSIFAIIAMFSLNYGVFNNGMMDYKDDRDGYSYSLLRLSNIITICFAILVFSFQLFSPGILKIDIKYLALMFVVFLFHPAYNFWLARQRYEYNYKPALLASVCIAVLGPLISIAAVIILRNNRVAGRIFGLEGTLLIIYAFFYVLLGKKSGWKCNKTYWKEAFLFNLPLLPHYLSTYVLSSSDRLMISEMVSKSATSYYSVAYTIASLGLIIWTAINGSLIPFTYEKCKEKDFSQLKKIVNGILIVIAACCFLVILIAPEVIAFLGSSEYRSSVVVVPPIVGGIFFQVHYSLYANVLYYHRKPKWVMTASITAAILNIITNYVFIGMYGYVAAGYTTLGCYMIQAIIDYLAMRRVAGESVYDIRFILLLSVIVILVSVMGPMLYSFTLLRYVIIAAVITIAIIKRDYLKRVVGGLIAKKI